MPDKNTKFRYMYRDGANYKTCHEIVFAGQATPEQELRLRATLEDDCNFIAAQVGLPELFPWMDSALGLEADEDDHDWHEFVGLLWTDEEPTEIYRAQHGRLVGAPSTIEELVVTFERALTTAMPLAERHREEFIVFDLHQHVTDLQTALSLLDELAVGEALDAILDFSAAARGSQSASVPYTVLSEQDVVGVSFFDDDVQREIFIGDYQIWVDRQDPNNVGWCWRRAFIDGVPTTGEDDTFDTAEELHRLLAGAGYL